MFVTAMTLFAALTTPVRLAAQHTRYKLVDIPTFGGPAAYTSGFGDGEQFLNNRGMVVGQASTPTPDPFFPNCNVADCFVAHAFRWQNGVLTDLGTLLGINASVSSGSNAINARGWVAGVSQTGEIDPLTGGPAAQAVLWKDSEMIDLGTLGTGIESGAAYVNNGGQVVGISTFNTVPVPSSFLGAAIHAFIWEKGVMRDLGTLGGPDAGPSNSCANERNGLVAGSSSINSIPNPNTGMPTTDPFLWENGTMLDLGTLGGTFGFAQCANNRGQVVGQSNLAGDVDQHAFFWDHGTLMDLGTLGGSFSVAIWLNNAGEAVGGATTTGDELFHATLWRKGAIADLGTLEGDCFSIALAINSKGQIVGKSFSCDGSIERVVLWDKGSIIDLNAAIPPNSSLQLTGLQVRGPFDINDRGEIAGRGLPAGCDDADVCGHDFLLIPCDHAGTQGCEGNVDVTARPNTTSVTTSATTPTHLRHTTKEFVSQWRARLSQRYHIPGLGAPRD